MCTSGFAADIARPQGGATAGDRGVEMGKKAFRSRAVAAALAEASGDMDETPARDESTEVSDTSNVSVRRGWVEENEAASRDRSTVDAPAARRFLCG